MSDEPTARRNPCSDIAPALGDYTENVLLFGHVWTVPACPSDVCVVCLIMRATPFSSTDSTADSPMSNAPHARCSVIHGRNFSMASSCGISS